jgi:hypothetical protein
MMGCTHDGDDHRHGGGCRGAGFGRSRNIGAGCRSGDGNHGSDGQVDSAGGNHQGHAQCNEDGGCAVAHDVDDAAVEVAVLHPETEEVRPEDLVDGQECQEGKDRPGKAVFQK